MDKIKEYELAAIDNMVAYLLDLRKAVENTGGVGELGIRKKQPHWVVGDGAGSPGITAIYRGPRIEVSGSTE